MDNNNSLNAILQAYRMDESTCVMALLKQAKLPDDKQEKIQQYAEILVSALRTKKDKSIVENFLAEYSLSNEEGIALLCLAEAILRIPDPQTVDRLITDKLTTADWQKHIDRSESLFVNAATWGLMLSSKLLQPTSSDHFFRNALKNFFKRTEQFLIRHALKHAMKFLTHQFVIAETLDAAIKKATIGETKGYCYSYDMLGEAALTTEDAERYFQAYLNAIALLGQQKNSTASISVKLSALHPRYEHSQKKRVLSELTPRLLILAQQAKAANIALTLDAEEANRVFLMLEIFSAVFTDPSLADWQGFGLALQAYQKCACAVIDYLAELSLQMGRRINVRLVKGAYWDSEIKESQMLGLEDYPVFTRKESTDVSYQACAKKLLSLPHCFYPQFATHNAYTVAMILTLVGDNKEFEFQRLYGMGEALYEEILKEHPPISCRIYAPVGIQQDLLPYLVRRLLENGANFAFVNRLTDEHIPVITLTADPISKVTTFTNIPHPHIPKPSAIFPNRKNSRGFDLSNELVLHALIKNSKTIIAKHWLASPIIVGKEHYKEGNPVYSPSNQNQLIGHVQTANIAEITIALNTAYAAAKLWNNTPVTERAACLVKTADLLEKHRDEFITLAIYEAGKTISDAIAELREAVDYCHYYAAEAIKLQQHPTEFAGYTGEKNTLAYVGRGVMVCISPWNFPLAIFMGQIVACLVTGNTVLAKPAKQTPLIAALAIRLLHTAGIPNEVLHFLPVAGEIISQHVLSDPRIAGVLLTGSTATAQHINQQLATRAGPIIPFIAETGGINAMIVDSSAYVEQVVKDVVASAFNSTGQRCSALRVLFVQQEIAAELIHKLKGVLAELRVGDPSLLETDVGPIIDITAKNKLELHAKKMQRDGALLCEANLTPETAQGCFFAPRIYQIENLQQLAHEVFGPILHVIVYERDKLAEVIDQINDSGYGLTLGIQSRINETIEFIQQRAHVGNYYVNRNMIGAVVGLQPFGGEGLSGTGPKAGGPNYLQRLCHERTLTINTAAIGGNASLVTLSE